MTDDIKKIAESALKKAGKHQIVIKNKKYTIQLLPATQALAVATQLFKICLPAMGAYFDGAQRRDSVMPEDENVYTTTAMLLVSQMDKVGIMDSITILAQGITCEGEAIDIDQGFRGDLAGLLIMLEFILKENCGPFMKEWLAAKGISLPSLSILTKKAVTTEE